jgi:zinc/manganese transport system substrate-binding protein
MPPRALLPALLAAPVLALTACGASPVGGDGPAAAATTNVLGDVLGDITACAGTTSTTLMGPGEDPHTFQPSSAQLAEVAAADLVVANGLGLEAGLETALSNIEHDGASILEVAPLLDPLPWGSESGHAEEDHAPGGHDQQDEHDHRDDVSESEPAGHDHDDIGHAEAGRDHADQDDSGHDHAGHDHGPEDPHFWMDAGRMAQAAHLIGDELAARTGDADYVECGIAVEESLSAVDGEVRRILDSIPADRRVLVTDHEAFGYFADAYDFERAGVVVPGGSTDAEPSSAELSALTHVIEETGVPVIFSNSALSSKLVDAVAAEVGTSVEVVGLHVGGLGPESSGAATYSDMMIQNATRVAEALSRSEDS